MLLSFKRSGVFALGLILVLNTSASGQATLATPADERWVCPPCGHEYDDHIYAEAGTCPICSMDLVGAGERLRAAILVFDGVQIIDYTGPYEVFGQARIDVFTVSADGEQITTAMGMSVNPHHSFETAPPADVLLVPGGDVEAVTSSEPVLDWVRSASAESDHVLSVCNGAFILAEAGLLDGLTATTFYGLLKTLARDYPAVTVVRDQRFVDNGKVVTSAGLSSGIDAALYLVTKLRGALSARDLARHLEYDWDPASSYARGALADYHLPELAPPSGVEVGLIEQDGDRDGWFWRWGLRGGQSVASLAQRLHDQLSVAGWIPDDASGAERTWRFSDEQNEPWRARTSVVAVAGNHEMSIRLERGQSTGPGH